MTEFPYEMNKHILRAWVDRSSSVEQEYLVKASIAGEA
jgi:hypothetical protein